MGRYSSGRRQFLMLSASLGMSHLVHSNAIDVVEGQRERSPNIVLIFLDDQGWSDMACYGHPVVKTPNSDRLAKEGVKFTRAYVTAMSCSASRASLLTGRYPHTNGVISLIQWHKPGLRSFPGWKESWEERTHRHSLKHSEVIIPQVLKRLGYGTALCGKWHVSVESPNQWGFDEVHPAPADFFARNRSNPFFYYYCPELTHRRFGSSPDFPYDPDEIPLPPYFKEDPELRKDLAAYYSAISNQDREIGKLLDALDENGLAENTIVILSSDSGPSWAKAKATLYENGIHTSLLIRYPARLPAGTVVESLASTIDVFPTLLELIDEPMPDRLQGISLLDVMSDLQSGGRDEVFCESNYHVYYNPIRCVVTDRWKYLRNFMPEVPFGIDASFWADKLNTPFPVPPRPEEELYDLKDDALESRNLAQDPEHQETLAMMRERLERWMRETNDNPMEEVKYLDEPRQYPMAWFGK